MRPCFRNISSNSLPRFSSIAGGIEADMFCPGSAASSAEGRLDNSVSAFDSLSALLSRRGEYILKHLRLSNVLVVRICAIIRLGGFFAATRKRCIVVAMAEI